MPIYNNKFPSLPNANKILNGRLKNSPNFKNIACGIYANIVYDGSNVSFVSVYKYSIPLSSIYWRNSAYSALVLQVTEIASCRSFAASVHTTFLPLASVYAFPKCICSSHEIFIGCAKKTINIPNTRAYIAKKRSGYLTTFFSKKQK